MKQLAPHYECFAPCLRGFGYSSNKKVITSYKDYARDLKLLLNEELVELKLLGFYILAHNIGNIVAIYLAHLMPESVKGIILLSSINSEFVSFKVISFYLKYLNW